MGNGPSQMNFEEYDVITPRPTTQRTNRPLEGGTSQPDVITPHKQILRPTQKTDQNEILESLKRPLVAEEDCVLKEKIKNAYGDDENSSPWLFSQQLFNSNKWQEHHKFSTIEMTPQDKNGFDGVYDFVTHLWERHSIKKYNITKIVAIKNDILQQIWERQLGNLVIRKGQVNFQLNWYKMGHVQNRQQVLNRLSKYIFKTNDNVYVIPVFHAPSKESVESICETGFAIFGTTDDGYFGKGIYATPQSDYAVNVYGKGVCFLCFACFFNPFPVVASDRLLGAGNIGKADVHFASVSPLSSRPEEKVYLAAKEDQEPVYDELVVFQESQIIPRYVIYYDK